MAYLNFKSHYNKEPEIKINGFDDHAFQGYKSISRFLAEKSKTKKLIIFECYPGVRYDEIKSNLIDPLNPELVIFSDDLALSGEEITNKIKRNLTDDRVFGVMGRYYNLEEFYFPEKVKKAQDLITKTKGLTIIYGFGASLISKTGIIVYCDLARWEIQLRYRSHEIGNWKINNFNEDSLKKYKRGYFIEWRLADKIKKSLFDNIDYLLDTNIKNNPKLITGEAFRKGMKQVVKGPFRLVPYFDPGVWGGQWMKEVCNLDKNSENYAWSFDGVPEENSLYLTYGQVRVEMPALNIVLYQPIELLGNKVHARFGTEFPIRFDFLDTMKGGNLSLQVHPLTEYIQSNFGMNYTQDESYYYLDAEEDAVVYLGIKENINSEDMFRDLEAAQKGEIIFDDAKYINKFPARKHDHFLIPAGTIHCSGKNGMVLEISTSAYIFTFKLWDWNRLGLDGLPRPVHIEHGKHNVLLDRDTEWVKENLINQIEVVDSGDGFIEERTGLHERQFIETRRHWFTKKVLHNTNNTVQVLNLVEGECVLIESPSNAFEPFEVHYAETFIIPACVGEYTIRPYKESENKKCGTIKAYIRS